MLYSVLEGIKNIAVFMLVGQLILHLTPGNYGKYLKPVLALVVLLQIAMGIFGTFRGNIQNEMNQNLTEYEQKFAEFEENCLQQTKLFQAADEEISNKDLINNNMQKNDQEEKVDVSQEDTTEESDHEIRIEDIIINGEQESVPADR